MEITKRKPVDLALNITPLIDIVFLLLIFFMLTSTFMREEAIELALPQSETGAQQEPEILKVTAVEEDSFLFEGQTLTASELKRSLLQRFTAGADQSVLLKIDKQEDVQLLVSAMDILKSTGYTDISLATE